jgi:hypothetical protein
MDLQRAKILKHIGKLISKGTSDCFDKKKMMLMKVLNEIKKRRKKLKNQRKRKIWL